METNTTPLEIPADIGRPVPSASARLSTNLSEFPWWILGILLLGTILIYNFFTNEIYANAFAVIVVGLRLTISITIISYLIATVLGLLTAFGQLSKNVIARNLAIFYVQVVRGIPILVQIFVIALVLVPIGVDIINGFGNWLVSIGLLAADNPLSSLSIKDISFIMRGVIALAISYGAFSSEIFRAGIQSIEKGQIEAASSLGLTRFQSMRLIILPQAIRRVLPPLGNDFIAMLKESALLSTIGVGEMTQLSRKHSAATFRFPETFYTLSFLYLSLTLILSIAVRFMERRLKTE